MAKPRGKSNIDESIVIKNSKKSGLAEFIRRPMPTDEEVESFEELVEESAYVSRNPAFVKDGVISLRDRGGEEGISREMEEEIDESLHEIYEDNNGKMIDVKKMDIKKRRGFFFWLFFFIFMTGGITGAAYGAYRYFYLGGGSDATAVEFSIEGKSEVAAGEEFFYSIHYKNLSNTNIRDVRIEVKFPDNFIFLDSYPESGNEKNDKIGSWNIGAVGARETGKIKIKGMMVGLENDRGIITADLTYSPENFSSEFKKETMSSTMINDIGIEIDYDYIASALIGQEDEVTIRLNPNEKNYIGNFRLTVEPQENIEIGAPAPKEEDKGKLAPAKMIRPGVWEIESLGKEEKILPIRIKFTEKKSDKQDIVVYFEKNIGDSATATASSVSGRYIKFHEAKLNFEVMKSDLNLTMIVNGARDNQGADFGQTLNYSIVYKNSGETDMKDVVIMAVLDSDFLDWASLKDENKGKEKGNTITWSKEEIPALETIAKHAEGTIDFSIDILNVGAIDPGKKYQAESYAQFSVGEIEEGAERSEDGDNRSNTVLIRINSDLKLEESARYFNEDNIPVGTGPHPPKTGETTSYKVYWKLNNNLHELSDLRISVKLPKYVSWDGKERSTAGAVKYLEGTHEVVWDIGRLPVTVYDSSAEWSLKITPQEEDKNTIMVLLPGSSVTARDNETEAELNFTTPAKTTKLEDDDIARGAGVVE